MTFSLKSSKEKEKSEEDFDRVCNPVKLVYTTCYEAWYQHSFLKGNVTPQCIEEFEAYKTCWWNALQNKLAASKKKKPLLVKETTSSGTTENVHS